MVSAKNWIWLKLVGVSRWLRGEVSTRELQRRGFRVGSGFSREGGVRIDASHCFLISIGNNVILANDVHILAHDASLKHHLGVSRIAPVTIGNNVFVGAKSVILPGVSIGDNIIIGAGSVVTRDLEAGGVYAGNPAQFICDLPDFLNRSKAKLKSAPIFDSSYFTHDAPIEKRAELKCAIGEGRLGFQMSENWHSLTSMRE